MRWRLLAVSPFIPLVAVFVFAIAGILFFNFWVYVILSVVCPAAAALIWYSGKKAEEKFLETEKKE